jgi:hypothetical protein
LRELNQLYLLMQCGINIAITQCPCNFVHKVCFKKTVTKHSSDTLLQFVPVFLKQTLDTFGLGSITELVKNDNHKWFVINRMSPDQVWIFCQFDNKTKICVPHSSVDVVGTKEDARPRKSIESRCLIKYKFKSVFWEKLEIISLP